MKRTLLISGLALVALFGGSMTLVALFTRQPTPASSPPAAIAERPASVDQPVVAASPSRPTPAGGAGAARAREEAAADDPSRTSMADRVTRKQVRKALLAAPVQSSLARCVDRDGGFGGSAAAGRIPRAQAPVLMLEIESIGGQLRIVDVQVQSWGGASAQAASCARKALRDTVIAASATEPGRRLRMAYPLNPRSDALAFGR